MYLILTYIIQSHLLQFISLVQLFYETCRTTIDNRQGVIIERDGKEEKKKRKKKKENESELFLVILGCRDHKPWCVSSRFLSDIDINRHKSPVVQETIVVMENGRPH